MAMASGSEPILPASATPQPDAMLTTPVRGSAIREDGSSLSRLAGRLRRSSNLPLAQEPRSSSVKRDFQLIHPVPRPAARAARELKPRPGRPQLTCAAAGGWRRFLRLSLVSCPIYLSPATVWTQNHSFAPGVARLRDI